MNAWRIGAAVASLWVALASAAGASEYHVVYRFTGGADGSRPSDLVAGPSGSLFGIVKLTGGTGIFKLDPPSAGQADWQYSLIFSQPTDPNVGAITPKLVFDPAGNLYFSTSLDYSIAQAFYYASSVFRLTPPVGGATAWTATRYAHHYSPGYSTVTSLALAHADGNGTLFGYGGEWLGSLSAASPHGVGAIFRISPPRPDAPNGIVSALTLFGLKKMDGLSATSLVLNGDGSFYGVTGGNDDWDFMASVFRLTPPAAGQTLWTRTNLTFLKGTQYEYPFGITMDRSRTIFGVLLQGGAVGQGAVLRVTPPAAGQTEWKSSLLYSFSAKIDGKYPYYPLVDVHGILFGVAGGGLNVCDLGCGILFKLTAPDGQPDTTPWDKHLVHAFGNAVTDGSLPTSSPVSMTLPGGTVALFGTTGWGGGAPYGGFGTVYEYVP